MTASHTTQDPQEPEKTSQEASKAIHRKVTPSGDIAEHMRAVNGPSRAIQAAPPTGRASFLSMSNDSKQSDNPFTHPTGISTTEASLAESKQQERKEKDVDRLPTANLPAANSKGKAPVTPDIGQLPTRAIPTPAGHRRKTRQQKEQLPTEANAKVTPTDDIEHLPTGILPAAIGNRQTPVAPDIEQLPTRALPAAQAATPGTGHQMQSAAPVSVTRTGHALRMQELEIEDGNVILHRSPNFFVRTAYRLDQKQKQNPLRRPTGRTTAMPRTIPNQEQRIAASDTRMMPKVAPINPVKEKTFPIPAWLEAIVLVAGLMVALIAHALNMFNFPRYELDEGTYMSAAWSILNGSLWPYAYGYGHPPLAWIQIAAWTQLTGGFFTFGNALNSGRVLMLVYALACSLLVYLMVRRLSGSRSAGLLAMIIFSLSPLSLTYQRQVLLDNVGTFWLLLSLYLLVVGNSHLPYIVSAAISFGIALLSKEIFLLFLPVMIYAVWLHTTKFQRKFALVAFIYSVIAVGSGFVLMAILKGELFPYSWHLPGDTHNHLSMLDTLVGQTQRGQSQGAFLGSWKTWTEGDMLLMIFSVAALAFNLIVGWWHRKQLMLALFAISFWILLIRGGVVLSFYLIPMIPLVALNAAMAINTVAGWIGKLVRFDLVRAVLVLGVIVAIIPYDLQNASNVFTQHPTSAQTAAMGWIRANVPHNAFIVINSYLYMDLRTPGGTGVGDGAVYPYAHVYFNVASDPELNVKLLQGNWDRIDYIVADSEMLSDIELSGGQMQILKDALDHSVLRAEFKADDHDAQLVISIYQVIHKIAPRTVSMPPGMSNITTYLPQGDTRRTRYSGA
jgi:4-amino-4-deoxy-L-arabinose transferase-like glycosyltransferase